MAPDEGSIGMRRERSTGSGRLWAAGTLAAAFVAASGCGGDVTPDEGGGDPRPTGALQQEDPTSASPTPEAPAGGVDLLGARDAALREYPGGVVYDVELEEDERRWDVELVHEGTERELGVETGSGKVSELEGENPDGPDTDLAGLSADSLDTAVEAALAESGGNRATDASVDEEDGRRVWEIEVDDDQTVDVDTENGQVVAVDS